MEPKINQATFPTRRHEQTAASVYSYFSSRQEVDTVLVTNSCARGRATPHSDLDMSILLCPDISKYQQEAIKADWAKYEAAQPDFTAFKASNRFTAVHLDFFQAEFVLEQWDDGGGPDSFEIEIGNLIVHSAPLHSPGTHFLQARRRWLPYYPEELRLSRLKMVQDACRYDLEFVPFYQGRALYFQAFDRLYKAFQEFLQALFIAHKTYPIAYNKWLHEQIVDWLGLPDLYQQILTIVAVDEFTGERISKQAQKLQKLLSEWTENQHNE